MKTIKIFIPIIFLSFVFFLNNTSVAKDSCTGNFQAFFKYTGQDTNPDGIFSNSSKDVPVGSFFKTELEVKAVGSNLEKEGENVNVVFVMDRSGSMGASGYDYSRTIQAKAALVNIADIFVQEGDPKNKLALVSYNQSVTLDQTLTADYQKLKSAIEKLSPYGATNIGGALRLANQHLESSGDEKTRQFIVLASDGAHNTGSHPYYVVPKVKEKVTVYTVGIGENGETEFNPALMQWIANESGSKEGKYYHSDTDDLVETFEEIIENILFPFKAEVIDVNLDLENFNNGELNLQNSQPLYTSFFNEDILSWKNLGTMKSQDVKNFSIFAKNTGAYGNNIPVNKKFLKINYNTEDEGGNLVSCNENVDIDIVRIGNPYECTGNGSTDIVTSECPNARIGLTQNYPWELVENCGFEKCKYECNNTNGYYYFGGMCIQPACKDQTIICSEKPDDVDLCNLGMVVPGSWQYDDSEELWRWQCSASGGAGAKDCSGPDYCEGEYRYYEVNP